MVVLARLSVSRPTGPTTTTPWYDEYILRSSAGRGSAVVLMTYTDGSPQNYVDNPVKLSLRVNDPAAFVQGIAADGNVVMRAPAPAPEPALGGVVVGYAKDDDGTLLEILPAEWPSP